MSDENRSGSTGASSVNAVTLVHIGAASRLADAVLQRLTTALTEEQPDLLLSQVSLTSASHIVAVMESCQAHTELRQNRAIIIFHNCHTTDNTKAQPETSNAEERQSTFDRFDSNDNLWHQMVSAAEQANIPVITALNRISQFSHSQINRSQFKTVNSDFRKSNKPATGGITPGKSGKPGYCTISIREDYYHHDTALLTRQVYSLPGIDLPENSRYLAYPVAPEKPGGTVALEKDNLTNTMAKLTPDWVIQSPPGEATATELYRELRFSSFQSAIRYMHQVAPACDVANHHPRWENNWRTLRIWLTTWDADQQITDRDIQLARYFDHIYREYGYEVS